jgi:hypothetical protein
VYQKQAGLIESAAALMRIVGAAAAGAGCGRAAAAGAACNGACGPARLGPAEEQVDMQTPVLQSSMPKGRTQCLA